jgi:hypothetical protein
MTKSVRIENADNSKYKILVEVVEINQDGTETVIKTTDLDYPTSLNTFTVHKTRFLRIRENGLRTD